MFALSQDECRSGKNGATDHKLTVAISFEIAVSKNEELIGLPQDECRSGNKKMTAQ